MRLRLTWLVVALVLSTTLVAHAEERTLSHDDGSASDFVSLETDGHFIVLDSPDDWKATFGEAVSFYGQRFGDVAGQKGAVVIWVPVAPPKIRQHTKQLGPLKLLLSREFDLSAIPEKAGWFTLPIDPVQLPPVFAVSLYTYSTDKHGVKIALGGIPEGRPDSYSASTHPGATGTATNIKFRPDGKDWLLRIKVRDSLQAPTSLDAAQIAGSNFSAFDDGSAETFVTFQKKGCLLRCDTAGPRDLDAVYVYGKLDGNWVGTTRNASILILDSDLKVLGRTKLPYNLYTNVASWNLISFSPIHVGRTFYVAVQPDSTPEIKFLVGVDSSSANKASLYGTSGAILDWKPEVPQATTNWMIRARYSK